MASKPQWNCEAHAAGESQRGDGALHRRRSAPARRLPRSGPAAPGTRPCACCSAHCVTRQVVHADVEQRAAGLRRDRNARPCGSKGMLKPKLDWIARSCADRARGQPARRRLVDRQEARPQRLHQEHAERRATARTSSCAPARRWRSAASRTAPACPARRQRAHRLGVEGVRRGDVDAVHARIAQHLVQRRRAARVAPCPHQSSAKARGAFAVAAVHRRPVACPAAASPRRRSVRAMLPGPTMRPAELAHRRRQPSRAIGARPLAAASSAQPARRRRPAPSTSRSASAQLPSVVPGRFMRCAAVQAEHVLHRERPPCSRPSCRPPGSSASGTSSPLACQVGAGEMPLVLRRVLPPAARGLVVVRAGVDHGLARVVVRQEFVAAVAAEGELQDASCRGSRSHRAARSRRA